MGQKPTDEAFHEAFGRALKVLRAERGLERKELAETAGLSYPYVSEIETGKKRPSSRAVLALAEALGVPAHHLWEMADALQTQTIVEPVSAPGIERSFFHSESAAPQIPPPSVAPMAAPRSRLARRRAEKADRTAPPVADAKQAPPEHRLLDELVSTAARLPAQDLEHLVDLARRLAR
jgi:transcriptional regulator with XRE-family HTH domain